MVEHAELVAVVHRTAATSKELAEMLMNSLAETPNSAQITLDVGQARAMATQLRVTANLIEGLLTENTEMIDRVNELVARTLKP